MAKKKENEVTEQLKAMPFQPITNSSKKKRKQRGQGYDVPIAERSVQWAKMKEEKLKKKKIEYETTENENCSFKPEIVLI